MRERREKGVQTVRICLEKKKKKGIDSEAVGAEKGGPIEGGC